MEADILERLTASVATSLPAAFGCLICIRRLNVSGRAKWVCPLNQAKNEM